MGQRWKEQFRKGSMKFKWTEVCERRVWLERVLCDFYLQSEWWEDKALHCICSNADYCSVPITTFFDEYFYFSMALLTQHCRCQSRMKGPIVQHLCKRFVLRFLWGQGNAERWLTTQQGRAKLCSFDSPKMGAGKSIFQSRSSKQGTLQCLHSLQTSAVHTKTNKTATVGRDMPSHPLLLPRDVQEAFQCLTRKE